jgi:hypothetical protein
VTAADGTEIPIPENVRTEDGRDVVVPSNAEVRVGTDDNGRSYQVFINIPSRISGDTRMVLGAMGMGSAGGAAQTAAARAGLRWMPRFLIGQAASRVVAVVAGVLEPNQPASQIFIRRQLGDVRVTYVVMLQ